MKFFDWLNDNQYGLFFGLVIILSLCKCSSGNTRIDTVKHEVEVQAATTELETVIDCNAQPDNEMCEKTKKRVIEALNKGVEISKEKDAIIETIQEENKELEKKARSWDTMWFYIYLAIGLIVVGFLLWLAWRNRYTVAKLLRLAGIPFPFFITPPQ